MVHEIYGTRRTERRNLTSAVERLISRRSRFVRVVPLTLLSATELLFTQISYETNNN